MSSDYKVEKWIEEDPPNPADLRLALGREGYSVFQWSDPPDAVYGPHDHDDDQSHWIISGRLELTVEGFGTVVLAPGDRDLMPAGTEHSARVLGEEPVVYFIGSKK
jgi:quercetin dioxygenase-like cupin family protein